MLSEGFLAELKSRNEISEVISSYVVLKRRGRNNVGLCPFHSEKTASFTVYDESQSFYCFGCGAGGDVISFVKRIENLDYIEAVRFLAQRAGLAMPEDGYDDSMAKLKQRILEINRQAARFYYQCLVSPAGKKALDYLKERGLTDQTIRHFGIGYAPDGWDGLLSHLKQKGYRPDEILAAAVANKNAKGNVYDMFRGRVMFPIIDIRGNVIAFGGRLLDGKGPKYLNSPDTPVFKKSRNLFALNFAKSAKNSSMILAEGYMDVIALHQAGFTNAVATLGTALTAEQTRLISQYCENVVIAYDSDAAGQTAAARAINLFGQVGIPVKVLKMTGAKDPDEYIKKFGAVRFGLLLEKSGSAMDFEIEKRKEKYNLEEPEGKVGFLKDIAHFLAGVYNPIERDVYLTRLSEELGVSKEPVTAQIDYIIKQREKARQKKNERDLRVFALDGQDKKDTDRARHIKEALAEERLIGILLKNPDFFEWVDERIQPADFLTGQNREIFAAIRERAMQNKPLELMWLADSLSEEQMNRLAGIVAKSATEHTGKKEAGEYIDVILEGKHKKTGDEIKTMDRGELEDYISGISKKKR